jgi:hypothetical protein
MQAACHNFHAREKWIGVLRVLVQDKTTKVLIIAMCAHASNASYFGMHFVLNSKSHLFFAASNLPPSELRSAYPTISTVFLCFLYYC